MPVRHTTAKEVLGGNSVVMCAQPFHISLKKNSAKGDTKAVTIVSSLPDCAMEAKDLTAAFDR